MVFHPVSCIISVYSLGFSVRVRVLGLGFCGRVTVIVSITGSVSCLNEKLCSYIAFVAPSGECLEKRHRCNISADGPM